MTDKQDGVWLLQNPVNPFPVAAHLSLTGTRLTVTLAPGAADAFTGWIEKALADPGVKDRIARGETITVFEVDAKGVDITWPKQFLGSAMKVPADGRDWIVSLAYPGSSLYSNYKMIKHRKESKAWRDAIEAAA